MKNEEKRFFEVEAYLRNEIAPEAAVAFQSEMAADPALARQVAEQRALQKVESLLIEDDLRASVKDWKAELDADEEPASPPATKSPRFPLWAILGLAAVLASLIWFWTSKPAEPQAPPNTTQQPETPIANDSEPAETPQEVAPQQQPPPQKDQTPNKDKPAPQGNNYLALATRFEEVPTYAGGDVRTGATSDDAFQQAMTHLGKNDFENAEKRLKAVKSGDEHWSDAQYNLGCLLYLQKKYKQAIPFLKTTAENPDFLYSDNARWYLTLSLLASGNVKDAKVQLEQLAAQPKGDFFKKAQDLQKEIKQ